MRSLLFQSVLFTGLFSVSAAQAGTDGNVLTLEMTAEAGQRNDPWLVGNQHSQNAIESLSVSAGTLPDPQMSLGFSNLPTDGFDFGQENMTQFKVGVSQMFPRGDSLAIRRKQLEQIASQFPFQRQDRNAKVVVVVSQLWLDAYLAQESIALIEKDRPLFEQLADVAEASYSSTVGRTRQQDIVRAQLELTRLDDRLTILRQQQEVTVERLSEWLSEYFIEQYIEKIAASMVVPWSRLVLSRELPDIAMLNTALYSAKQEAEPQILFEYFSQHPSVKDLEQKIKASITGIDLAKQKYKPEWGINANYGYRDDDPLGNSRADFFSVGATFDLPLFTANRQDKEVQSAVSQAEAVKTDKWLLVRNMIAGFEKSKRQLHRLNDRQNIYQETLLPEMRDQAEASLNAYTVDDGDFNEVVRARIDELNALIEALEIEVARQKAIIQMNYFFMKSADEIITSNRRSGELK
jgi:outer membrane protein TolC